jgi:sulfur-oxidizing protein SoxY
VSLGLATGLLVPSHVVAKWPENAFHTSNLNDAVAALTDIAAVEMSSRIEIQARTIAEDGAHVPVAIQSHLPNTRTIIILSETNPNPAIARYRIGPSLQAYVSTRIKMGGTGHVVALVETDKGFFSAKKKIQVTAGGCG